MITCITLKHTIKCLVVQQGMGTSLKAVIKKKKLINGPLCRTNLWRRNILHTSVFSYLDH